MDEDNEDDEEDEYDDDDAYPKMNDGGSDEEDDEDDDAPIKPVKIRMFCMTSMSDDLNQMFPLAFLFLIQMRKVS